MSGDREATSKKSSVHDDAGYDELYSLGRKPEEYLSSSPEKEPSVHSFAEDEKEYEEDEEAVDVDDEEGEVEGESEGNDEDDIEEVERQEVGNGSKPFILPLIWTVNDFYSTMSPNIFNKLCDRF